MSEASKSCPSYRCQTSTIPSLVPELCTSYFQKHNMFYIHFSRNIKWTQECQRPKSCSLTLSTSIFLEKIDIIAICVFENMTYLLMKLCLLIDVVDVYKHNLEAFSDISERPFSIDFSRIYKTHMCHVCF